MKLVLADGTLVTLTEAQYYAAKAWCWRTREDPETPQSPNRVFPARDNIDNGNRRCCTGLAAKRVLRGTSLAGYTLDRSAREHMMRQL